MHACIYIIFPCMAMATTHMHPTMSTPEIVFSGSMVLEREIVGDTLLKPFSSKYPANTGKKIPLTTSHEAAGTGSHVAGLFVFRPPVPTNTTLISSLSRALDHFPHFAGVLVNAGDPCIVLDGTGGVRVVEVLVVSAALDDILPIEPSSKVAYLHPAQDMHPELLLHVQINLFVCGGMVLAVSCHRHLIDGESMSSLLVAWSQIARAVEVNPIPFQYDLSPLSTIPRNYPPTSTKNSSHLVDRNENYLVHFSSDFIKRLKQECNMEEPYVCLVAHMWKKMTLARRSLKGEEMTSARVALNGRQRLQPDVVLKKYFGNMVLWANPAMKANDLLHGSYSYVTSTIHESLRQVDDKHFKLEVVPDVEVESWLGLEFHKINFGTGSPIQFVPAFLPVEGLMIFLPSFSEEGAVDVAVALCQKDMAYFKEIVYSLDDQRKTIITSML